MTHCDYVGTVGLNHNVKERMKNGKNERRISSELVVKGYVGQAM